MCHQRMHHLTLLQTGRVAVMPVGFRTCLKNVLFSRSLFQVLLQESRSLNSDWALHWSQILCTSEPTAARTCCCPSEGR